MKQINRLGLHFLFVFMYVISYGQEFVTTWNTENPGSSNDNQITIPIIGGGTFSASWHEVGNPTNAGTVPEHTGSLTIDFPSGGIYQVEIMAESLWIFFQDDSDNEKILTIEEWGSTRWVSMEKAFYGCKNLKVLATDAPDLSVALSMNSMFYNASSFNSDISHWNVSNLEGPFAFELVFYGATSFNQDIGNWDVSNGTSFDGIFGMAGSFNGDISNWDLSNATDLSGMFAGASSFDQDISSWNVSVATNLSGMFSGASSFNQDIGNWNTSKATNLSGMFEDAIAFNQDIGRWDVSNATSLYGMFAGATSFDQDLDNWDVSSVTSMGEMFRDAISFNSPIGNWNVSNVMEMFAMFQDAHVFNQPIGEWNVQNVQIMNQMFASYESSSSFNQDIGNWNVSNVVEMIAMFENATAFNQDLKNWDVSNVTNMSVMFGGASSFNRDLGGWNVGSVTSMNSMLSTSGVSTENYDNTLTGWASLSSLQSGVSFGAEDKQYCKSGLARESLITNYSWNIFDVGRAKPIPDVMALPDLFVTGCILETATIPTATDCDGTIINAVSHIPFPIEDIGEIEVFWIYTYENDQTISQTQKITFDCPLGNEYKDEQAITIYPNPSTGMFDISNTLPMDLEVQIFNVSGQQALVKAQSKNSIKQYDLKGLEAGVYYVRATYSNGFWTKKIIIQ